MHTRDRQGRVISAGAAALIFLTFLVVVTALHKALARMDNNAELHNTLGVALAQLGRTAEAEDQFNKALTLDPHHAGARQNVRRLSDANSEGEERHDAP